MRPLALALTALALTCLSCESIAHRPAPPSGAATFVRDEEHTTAGRGVKSFTIRSGPGALHVRGVEGSSVILVKARVQARAIGEVEAQRINEETQVKLLATETPNPLLVVEHPRLAAPEQNYSVDLTISVPAAVHVVVEDETGSIDIAGLTGGLELSNAAGPLTIEEVSGGLEVINAGEHCAIRLVNGRISVKDGPGDLSIEQAEGEVWVQDTRGDLRIGHITGNVTASNNPQGAHLLNVVGNATLINIPAELSEVQDVANISFRSSNR